MLEKTQPPEDFIDRMAHKIDAFQVQFLSFMALVEEYHEGAVDFQIGKYTVTVCPKGFTVNPPD